jgi:cytochrome b
MQRILIWDVPTRVFHWTLALSFAGAWFSGESDLWRSTHVFLGYLMLGLIGFRVVWGLLGTRYARFASFWFGPRAALVYVRQTLAGHAPRYLGHNPAGGLAIFALLLLALAVGATGFFVLGSEEQHGPAAGWLSRAQSPLFRSLHEASAYLMLLLVVVHLLGVLVESVVHRENLARSMVTGTKAADPQTPAVQPRRTVAALMLLLMAAFGVCWYFYAIHAALEARLGRTLGSPATPHVAFTGPKLADNAQWRSECGSCHLAFHPSLLPRRSWQRIMAEQDRHFGSDLALDATTSAALLAFLVDHAADLHESEPAFKIDASLKSDAVPLRVTETPYWIDKHHEISDAQWQLPQVGSKANCAACHLDADAGTFEDAAMRMPKVGAKR